MSFVKELIGQATTYESIIRRRFVFSNIRWTLLFIITTNNHYVYERVD